MRNATYYHATFAGQMSKCAKVAISFFKYKFPTAQGLDILETCNLLNRLKMRHN